MVTKKTAVAEGDFVMCYKVGDKKHNLVQKSGTLPLQFKGHSIKSAQEILFLFFCEKIASLFTKN